MPVEALSPLVLTERREHYLYLKEFRTKQCPEFVVRKCPFNRPYTCFNWHYQNHRRRRPVRRQDGSYNYSSDVYCQNYDETKGTCPDGDSCPFLHHVVGDVERHFHLRYFKTSLCMYDTDDDGNCMKNGRHCPFAHGPSDIRVPCLEEHGKSNYDDDIDDLIHPDSFGLMLQEMYFEDPVWNDPMYVLCYYKTRQCLLPTRLCRQGFACPLYHMTKDMRRSPLIYKYRSMACPSVKSGEDWGEPSHCDNGDDCTFCHTRTEQQFHPEVYKSSICNDSVQQNYCPRGMFCAFAHGEEQLHYRWSTALDNSHPTFATFVRTDANWSGLGTRLGALEDMTYLKSSDNQLNFHRSASMSEYCQQKEESSDSSPRRRAMSLSYNSMFHHQNSDSDVHESSSSDSSVNFVTHFSQDLPFEDNAELMLGVYSHEMHSSATNEQDICASSHVATCSSSIVACDCLRDSESHSNQMSNGGMHYHPSDSSLSALWNSDADSDGPGSTPDMQLMGSDLPNIVGPFTHTSHVPNVSNGSTSQPQFGSQRSDSDAMDSDTRISSENGCASSEGHHMDFMASSECLESRAEYLQSELARCDQQLVDLQRTTKLAQNMSEKWKLAAAQYANMAKWLGKEMWLAVEQSDQLSLECVSLRTKLENMIGCPYLCPLDCGTDLEQCPIEHLQQIYIQLHSDFELLGEILMNSPAQRCAQCNEPVTTAFDTPCGHYVLCDSCSTQVDASCPRCLSPVLQNS